MIGDVLVVYCVSRQVIKRKRSTYSDVIIRILAGWCKKVSLHLIAFAAIVDGVPVAFRARNVTTVGTSVVNAGRLLALTDSFAVSSVTPNVILQ